MTDTDAPKAGYLHLDGEAWHRRVDGAMVLICDADTPMAVAYDSSDGTLHKHGNESVVSAWAATHRKALASFGMPAAADSLCVVSFPATPETVEELNACIDCTGRVLRIAERLTSMEHDIQNSPIM